jgi:hypothetical protein
MNVLYYSSSLTGIGKRFLRIVFSHVPKERIELCRSIAALEERLHQLLGGMTIAVLHITRTDELEALIARRNLLEDFRIIMILPDSEGLTTALGHALRPRFVVYSDGDLPDASVVLGKMLQGKKSDATIDPRRQQPPQDGQGVSPGRG